MRTGAAGLAIIKKYEQGPRGGFAATAYACPAGLLTIGWGHVILPTDKFQPTLSAQQADDLLAQDLAKFESGVNGAISGAITQNQLDAMVCLAYNIGVSAFSGSTLARKFNAGDLIGAYNQFARWDKAGGKVLKGLQRRRAEEAALFATV